MRLRATTILIAAAVLAAGGVLFARMTDQDPWAVLKMVAICGAAIVGVGAMIVHSDRTIARESQAEVSETNAAFRTLASRAHLDIVEPTRGADRKPSDDRFCQARGTYRGIEIRASVIWSGTDRVSTVLVFLGLVLDHRQLKSLSDVVDRADSFSYGVAVCLDRSPKFWTLTDRDRIPETDVARLQLALDRVCDLAGMNQAAARPETGR